MTPPLVLYKICNNIYLQLFPKHSFSLSLGEKNGENIEMQIPWDMSFLCWTEVIHFISSLSWHVPCVSQLDRTTHRYERSDGCWDDTRSHITCVHWAAMYPDVSKTTSRKNQSSCIASFVIFHQSMLLLNYPTTLLQHMYVVYDIIFFFKPINSYTQYSVLISTPFPSGLKNTQSSNYFRKIYCM